MFTTANEDVLFLCFFGCRIMKAKTLFEVKAFINLFLAMSRGNTLVFVITEQLKCLNVEGKIRCMVNDKIGLRSKVKIQDFAFQLWRLDIP